MKINFENFSEFMDFVPVIVNLAIQNPDLLSDDAEEYFNDISKKIKAVTRQYFVSAPKLRLKLKRLVKSFDNHENTLLSIKADKSGKKTATTTEEKYLTENDLAPTMSETVLKYLKED